MRPPHLPYPRTNTRTPSRAPPTVQQSRRPSRSYRAHPTRPGHRRDVRASERACRAPLRCAGQQQQRRRPVHTAQRRTQTNPTRPDPTQLSPAQPSPAPSPPSPIPSPPGRIND
ncbi:uncharacterized protein K452DRAFT_284182, partial [Aplosporella prunicola CBS 121167]